MVENHSLLMVLNSHDVLGSYQPARITIGVILGVMAYILLTLAPETLSPRRISQPLTSTPFFLSQPYWYCLWITWKLAGEVQWVSYMLMSTPRMLSPPVEILQVTKQHRML